MRDLTKDKKKKLSAKEIGRLRNLKEKLDRERKLLKRGRGKKEKEKEEK
jgi:hypothetical protein